MTTDLHITDAAWELALGDALEPPVLAHIGACPRCRRAIAEARELAAALGAGEPVPRRSPERRARLVGEAAHLAGPAGLRLRAASVAALLGLPVAEAAARLDRLADPAAWRELLPGFSICPIGQVGDTDRGFVRAEPGARFPEHRHPGAEVVLVLQGSCHDSRAGWLGPGDRAAHDAGTHHHFTVPDGAPLLFAYTAHGLEFVEAPRAASVTAG